MKVAKGMDSVFATSSEKDLDFDILFDDDDTIIDLVAGVDESGEYITGKNPEYGEYIYNEDGTAYADGSPIADKDSEDLRDGDVKYNTPGETEGEDTNDVKDNDKEWKVGGDNSAMDKAYDVTPAIKDAIGEGEEEICKGCGKPLSACECSLEEFAAMNFGDFDLFGEDAESEVSKYVDDTFEKELSGAKEDPITDKNDSDVRDGDAKYNTPGKVEGEDQDVIGAALEGYSDDDLISIAFNESEECESPEECQKTNNETVPDCVQTDGSSNNIGPDYADVDMNDLNESDLINIAMEAAEEEEIASDDDDDIEMIDKDDIKVDDVDLSVDYDDDELIDMVMNDEV